MISAHYAMIKPAFGTETAAAEIHDAVPTEVLPHDVDSEPALIRFILAEQVKDHSDMRLITWEDFFVKFDSLGLSFVYDDDSTSYNEILQIEELSPYRKAERNAASSYN